jgi:hypothetical protein
MLGRHDGCRLVPVAPFVRLARRVAGPVRTVVCYNRGPVDGGDSETGGQPTEMSFLPARLQGRIWPARPARGAADPVGALLVRPPHTEAETAVRQILSSYPPHILRALRRRGARIWLLEPTESVATVPLLREAVGELRWFGGSVAPDECAGLTIPLTSGPLVIAPWHRPPVLRHEVGHALGALLSERHLSRLAEAFKRAGRARHWLVPLAARSPGEYLACGAACFAQPGGQARLLAFDSRLGGLLAELWQGAGPQATSHGAQPAPSPVAAQPAVTLGSQRLGRATA